MKTSGALVILAITCACALAAKFPPSFVLCKKSSPDVDECLREAIGKAMVAMADGIPSLKLLPIDPLAVTEIIIEQSPNRPISFRLDLLNVTQKGLKTTQVRGVKSDLDKRYVEIKVFIKEFDVSGDYEINGKFLVLPLRGKGKATFFLRDCEINLKFEAEPTKKNGNIHWNVYNFNVDIVKVSRLETRLSNLFNGDETIAKPTLQALNDNWSEFWAELRPSIEQTFGYIYKNIANIILSKIPEKDMFL